MNNENWQQVELRDIATITMGQSPKSEFYNDHEGVPFLQGTRTFSHIFPKIDTYTAKVTKLADKGDILFSVRAPVGDMNIAPMELCIGRGLARIRPKENNHYFVYYLLQANKHRFESHSTGTIFSSINKKSLETLTFKIPDLAQQRAISSMLWDIDCKIELNLQIIANLEQLGKTMYEQWFSHFNFPDQAGAPYQANGGKMVESELGMIPVHWKVCYASELGEFKNGINYNRNTTGDSEVDVCNVRNIVGDGFLMKDELDMISIDAKKASSYQVARGDTLIVRSASPGETVYINNPKENTIYSGFVIRFRPQQITHSLYMFFYFYRLKEQLDLYSTGTTLKNLNQQMLKTLKVIVPTNEVLERFQHQMSDVVNLIHEIQQENNKLKQLRDTLLPKLLSGEIDLNDISEVTEDVPIS